MRQLIAQPTSAVDGYARNGVVMLRRVFDVEEIAGSSTEDADPEKCITDKTISVPDGMEVVRIELVAEFPDGGPSGIGWTSEGH